MWSKSVLLAILTRNLASTSLTKSASNKLHYRPSSTAAYLRCLSQHSRSDGQQQWSAIRISGIEPTNQEPIEWQICRGKWKWIEHSVRKPSWHDTPGYNSSGTWMGSSELVDRPRVGDMAEVMYGVENESLWAVMEPGEIVGREPKALETCGWNSMLL